MIEYNPIYKKNGSLNGAITTAPSNSLIFDLAGKAIWAKGVKLKGTDHTYTFSHDNYITLTNTPGSDESEDIKIGVNITTLKAAIDTTYSVVTASSNGLAPMFSSGNLADTDNTDHYYLGIKGSTLKWYKNAYRQLKVGDNVVLGVTDRDPLQIVSADSNLSVSWNSTNKLLVIKNEKPAIGDLTDINVSQFKVTDNTNYRLLFKGTANDNNYTGVSRFSEYLLFNPSTKLLTINGNRVITAVDVYVGATSEADATVGLVPVATSAQRTYFLRGDGTWLTIVQENTWRPIQVSGSEKLGGATDTGALNFVAGTGIEVSWDTTNKRIVITNTAPDQNHNTHYTTSLYIGENNNTKANVVATNPYLKLFDDDTRRSTLRFVSGTGITIGSDANGNITITNSAPDLDHNTDFNVQQTPQTDNINRPLMMINGGTTAGEQTTTTIFSTGIYANTSTNMITANGFVKAGSDDTYVLLGGGGHKAETNLSVNYAASAGSVSWTNVTSGTNNKTLYLDFPNFAFRDANGNWILGKDDNSTGTLSLGSAAVAQNVELNSKAGNITLTGTGNVGIGTRNPSQKLDVNGNISIGNEKYITVGDNRFIYHSYDSSNTANNLSILASGITHAGKVLIRPYGMDYDTNATTFLSNGNVGISITSPTEKLQVMGNIKAVSSGDALSSWSYRIIAGDSSYGGVAFLGTYNDSSIVPGVYSHNAALSAWNDVGIGGTTVRFYINGYENSRLTSTGLGIGTTSPSYKLHVVGDIFSTIGFIKYGSSDSYVLLGGGGHKAISDFAMSDAYVKKSGDTMTGPLTIKRAGWGSLLNIWNTNTDSDTESLIRFYNGDSLNGTFLGAIGANSDRQPIYNYAYIGTYRIWTEYNNGHTNDSSGINADLLDGQHGSYYATADDYVKKVGDTMTGALIIKGITDSGLRSQGGFNKAYANIILLGDNTYGVSGIVFKSMKANDTDINSSSDVAFIQYHALGVTASSTNSTPTEASSGEKGRLVIGIGNDTAVGYEEELWLQTPGTTDLKHYVVSGAGAAGYTILDSNNFNLWAAALSHTHDDRYYTETESDNKYVKKSGDVMSGRLIIKAPNWGEQLYVWNTTSEQESLIRFYNNNTNGDGVYLGAIGSRNDKEPVYNYPGIGTYKLWNEYNDGHNSGLDADLLDGQHGSYYATANDYVKKIGDTMSGKLVITGDSVHTTEGGEINLAAAPSLTTLNGIVLDQYNGYFRIFGIASADGTTKTGVGNVLYIDPYAKTITGGYSFDGTAARLSTTSKSVWGQTYWTSGGIPTTINSNLDLFVDVIRDSGEWYNYASDGNGNLSIGTTGKNHTIELRSTTSGNTVYLDTSGNVGIGTSTNTLKLTVNGYVALGMRLYMDTQNILYCSNGERLSILACGEQNGTIQIRPYAMSNDVNCTTFLSNGNVGIGLTNPSEKLDVNGNIRALSSSVSNGWSYRIIAGDTTNGVAFLGTYNPGSTGNPTLPPGVYSHTHNLGAWNNIGIGGGDIYFFRNHTLLGIWNSTGLGIGTTSPSCKLDIWGNTRIYGTSPNLIFYDSDANSYNSTNAQIQFNNNYATVAAIKLSSLKLQFEVNNTNAITIINTNNVGLGTDSPGYKLEVNGDIYGKGFMYIGSTNATEGGELVLKHHTDSNYDVHLDQYNGTGTPQFRFWSNPGSMLNIRCDNGYVGIGTGNVDPAYRLLVSGIIYTNSDVYANTIRTTAGGYSFAADPDTDNISIGTTSRAHTITLRSTSSANTLHLDSSGNIGINTTSPSYKLDINGNARVVKTLYVDGDDLYPNGSSIEGGEIVLKNVHNSSYHAHLDVYYNELRVWANGVAEFSLDLTNGNLTCTNFYTTSDRNKKQNISSFSEHIRKFQLKDTEKWHYGVIAQEVEEMFRDGEEGNMTVNYNSILSFYIGQLENKVKMLEERIKRLESK